MRACSQALSGRPWPRRSPRTTSPGRSASARGGTRWPASPLAPPRSASQHSGIWAASCPSSPRSGWRPCRGSRPSCACAGPSSGRAPSSCWYACPTPRHAPSGWRGSTLPSSHTTCRSWLPSAPRGTSRTTVRSCACCWVPCGRSVLRRRAARCSWKHSGRWRASPSTSCSPSRGWGSPGSRPRRARWLSDAGSRRARFLRCSRSWTTTCSRPASTPGRRWCG